MPEIAPSDPLAAVAALEGVPSALAAARDAIDARLRDRGRRRTGPDVTTASLLLGAAASAELAGSTSTVDDLRAGRGDQVAAGCLRLATELLGLLPAWRSSPSQALARAHVLVSGPATDPGRRGRPATPAGADRLRGLAAVVTRPTTAPALAVAAVVHAELLTAAPFGGAGPGQRGASEGGDEGGGAGGHEGVDGAGDGVDGVVARAAERLVLVDRGVDPVSVTVPEAGHASEPAAYRAALAAYSYGSREGVQAWLLYAAEAFTRAAEHAPLPD